jgi:hypothetical protein
MLGLPAMAGATGAASQEHPQDLLKTPWIKAAWAKALAGERFARQDSWIPSFAGVSSAPQAQSDASGQQWTVANLCQPRNCSDNKLIVMLDAKAQAIWALQKTDGPARERFFGKPDASMQGLLRAALAGNLAAASAPAQSAAAVAPATTSTATSGAAIANGAIEGELSYPSDYIPADLQVCAEETESKRLTCSARKIRRGNQARYTMSLPPGLYFVFAQTKDSPGQRAYYSEFVVCGLNAACKSHKPIAVSVTSGAARKGINPQDWYAQQ